MNDDIFSPNQQYKISFERYEMRMSHWINQPFLIRVQDNVCLFALDVDNWSAWPVRWIDDSTVRLSMRKYPGLIGCTLTLYPDTMEAQAISQTGSVAGLFAAVHDWVVKLT